jgi:hypothetical protein
MLATPQMEELATGFIIRNFGDVHPEEGIFLKAKDRQCGRSVFFQLRPKDSRKDVAVEKKR